MPDNTPDVGTVEEPSAVDALADILDDPDDIQDTEEDEADADDTDDPDGEEERSEARADDDDDEEDDGSDDVVPDDAKVKWADGTTTTIAELKSGSLMHGDYTKKTQELAETRRSVQAQVEQYNQANQKLSEKFDQTEQWLGQIKPREPEGTYEENFLEWGAYEQQMRRWTEADNYWKAQREEHQQAIQADAEAKRNEYLKGQYDALVEKVPVFKDISKLETLITEAAKITGERYGISEQELRTSVSDHRFILLLRDMVKAERTQNRAPRVKEALEAKPKMVRGSKRNGQDIKTDRNKRARNDRLRETGAFDDGVRALMDLDL